MTIKFRPIWSFGGCWFAVLTFASMLGACTDSAEHAGASKLSLYNNPIVGQRADPWIHRTSDGRYYFTATVPEFNRIELRSADSLLGLENAVPKVIWRKHWRGPMSAHIWGPELHRIDGVWYIYFAAGSAEHPWKVRIYVLSNRADDPLVGEWIEEGRLQTEFDAYALDATTFEHRGQRYLIWSQKDPEDLRDASLYISAMASPTELRGPEVLLSEPEYAWEKNGIAVNLGPAVLIKHSRVFVTYSGSASDRRSAIGLLWAHADADLLNPESWHKSSEPVFFSSADMNRYGPGHSSFTVAEDGKTDILLYHNRQYREMRGDDPNRHTRARVIHWSDDGWPLFESSQPD
jgi:GH43 family beta-xylosidase